MDPKKNTLTGYLGTENILLIFALLVFFFIKISSFYISSVLGFTFFQEFLSMNKFYVVAFFLGFFGFIFLKRVIITFNTGEAFSRLVPDLLIGILCWMYLDQGESSIYVIIIRQILLFVLYYVLYYFARIRKSSYSVQQQISPITQFILAFIILTFTGSIILSLPISHAHIDKPVAYIDALFTAVSAITVTGLTTVDAAGDFSFFGQIIILMLIQVGGLGIMTFTGLAVLLTGQTLGIRQKSLMGEYADKAAYKEDFRYVVFWIIRFSFIVEGLTAAFLFITIYPILVEEGSTTPITSALYSSIFHAISGFCNAGFSIYSDSLFRFIPYPLILLIISINVTLGALGFFVCDNIIGAIRIKLFPRKDETVPVRLLSDNTKVVLLSFFWFTIISTLLYLIFELRYSLTDTPFDQHIFSAFIKSSVIRRAGFSCEPWNDMDAPTVWLTVVTMFFSGGPGSTAGGVKLTALFFLFISMKAILTRSSVSYFKRNISMNILFRLFILIVLSAFLLFLSTVVLVISENKPFITLLFEVTSGFATVGLSLGLTPELTPFGKMVVAFVMFMGRVGPPVFVMLSESFRPFGEDRLPKEVIYIG